MWNMAVIISFRLYEYLPPGANSLYAPADVCCQIGTGLIILDTLLSIFVWLSMLLKLVISYLSSNVPLGISVAVTATTRYVTMSRDSV